MLSTSLRRCSRLRASSRQIHSTTVARATTPLTMPALSPTMTEGSVSSWKFKEGDAFKAGDVLLEIQTDKAAIDVEAQDDGILGKILVQNDTAGVQVGATIALLAEEGDDLSAIEIPSDISSASASEPEQKEDTSSASSSEPPAKPAPPPPAPKADSKPSHHVHPTHTAPLLPSVLRLLSTNGIKDATIIEPTGHKGMLTKGDVLAHLGLIKNPRGSEKEVAHPAAEAKKAGAEAPKKPDTPKKEMDGVTFRRLIADGLKAPAPAPIVREVPTVSGFDSILSDYAPLLGSSIPPPKTAAKDPFDSVLGL